MILSAHQPAYLPWLGYFDKIARSDVFVFLDSVQFEKNSFTNRNRVKTPNGPIWLTVPVLSKGHTQATMESMLIDQRPDWKRKHLESIRMNYRKAPRFDECFPGLQDLYRSHHDRLVDLCYDHLLYWLNELAIPTTVVRSSTLALEGKKSELILELCTKLGANHYISGALGCNYLEMDSFSANGISIEIQDYRHPTYPQMYGDFLPNMGIVDFLMNTESKDFIRGTYL